MRPTDWIIILLAGTAFGASFGLNEVLLAELGPLTISALRIGIAALGCWAWTLLSTSGERAIGRFSGRLALLGVFQFALPFALLPFAQMHITSSVAGIANALTPVATLVVSFILTTGERVTAPKIFGLIFGGLGTIVLVSGNGQESGSDPIYVALAILVTFSYALALNIAKTLGSIKATTAITSALTFGFVLIAPLALMVEGVPRNMDPAIWLYITILGLGLTAVPFLVLYSMMGRVGAINVSLVTFVAPVSAFVIGSIVFEEALALANIAGIVFILLGLASVDGRLLTVMMRPNFAKS